MPDLAWQQWITGKIPMKLGDGVIQLKAPTNWKQTVQGKDVKIKELTISYKITGFGMTIPGVVTQHKLLDANDKTLHKGQITADFPLPAKRLLLTQLDTEEDLQSFENGHGQISITNRIQAPRIIWLAMYWPPSQSTLKKLNLLMTSAHKTGKVFDLNLLSLTSIEGDSLTKLWEPIIADHPMLKHMREKQNNKKKLAT